MLSFKKGRPLAIIKGGKQDGKTIRIYDKSQHNANNNKCCNKCTIECRDAPQKEKCCSQCGGCVSPVTHNKHIEDYIAKFKKDNGKSMTTKQLNDLEKALKEGMKYVEQKDEEVTEIKIEDGELIPLFTNDEAQIDRFVVYGVSGSGKSTFTGKIVGQYLEDHPNDAFVIFSRVENDKPLDKHNPIRIQLDDNIIDEPIDDKELENAIVVFDDVETLKNEKVKKAMLALRDDLAECGRHTHTHQVSTMHQLNFTRKETRVVLNEATGLVYFPKSGSLRGITNYFKNIIGLDSKEIRKIHRLPSRWIMINRNYPQSIIYDKGVISLHALLKDDDPKNDQTTK